MSLTYMGKPHPKSNAEKGGTRFFQRQKLETIVVATTDVKETKTSSDDSAGSATTTIVTTTTTTTTIRTPRGMSKSKPLFNRKKKHQCMKSFLRKARLASLLNGKPALKTRKSIGHSLKSSLLKKSGNSTSKSKMTVAKRRNQMMSPTMRKYSSTAKEGSSRAKHCQSYYQARSPCFTEIKKRRIEPLSPITSVITAWQTMEVI